MPDTWLRVQHAANEHLHRAPCTPGRAAAAAAEPAGRTGCAPWVVGTHNISAWVWPHLGGVIALALSVPLALALALSSDRWAADGVEGRGADHDT